VPTLISTGRSSNSVFRFATAGASAPHRPRSGTHPRTLRELPELEVRGADVAPDRARRARKLGLGRPRGAGVQEPLPRLGGRADVRRGARPDRVDARPELVCAVLQRHGKAGSVVGY
jgi:hypothetical protein